MKTENKPTFSIVVPLFNEEENVQPLIQMITEAIGDDPRLSEIVLVDDGSVDATAELTLRLAEFDQRIRLIRHHRNQGLGAAIRTGLKAAQSDFVLYTDADLPFDFKLIPQLLALASENRLVSGYRLNRGEGGRRWVLTTVYNFLIWLFFGLSMHDVNFACKIFPQQFLRAANFNSAGSFIDVEILLEARRFGLEIIEHPLVYFPRTRGLSTLSRPQVILFILREMFAYTGRLFSDQNTFLGLIRVSPLAKSAVCLTTALASASLLMGKIWSYQAVLQLSLTFGVIVAFLIFGAVVSRIIYRSWKLTRAARELKISE